MGVELGFEIGQRRVVTDMAVSVEDPLETEHHRWCGTRSCGLFLYPSRRVEDFLRIVALISCRADGLGRHRDERMEDG